MKISYISNSSTPSHVPNSLQIVKTCEYLSKNGNHVTLVVPNTAKFTTSINSFYDVKYTFKLKRLMQYVKNPRGIKYYTYSLYAFFSSINNTELIISRNFFVIFLCVLFKKNCILEIHHDISTESRVVNFLFKNFNLLKSTKLKKIIAISKNIKKHYQRQFNLKNKRIDVLPSGTALKFDYIFTKNKKNLNIGYFGSINYSKGINTILKLSEIDRSNKYYICGGLKEQVSEIKIKFNQENLNVLSHQDYKKLPKLISKMDILLMPYTKSVTAAGNVSDITKFTSPLKLFDYMAAGKTIMCSDIPVFKEIIKDKRNCIIVKNFINPFSWLMEINKIKNNFYLRNILARNSINDVKNFHHDKRAKKYLQGVK